MLFVVVDKDNNIIRREDSMVKFREERKDGEFIKLAADYKPNRK